MRWQDAVGGNISRTNIFSAGVYWGTGDFSINGLANAEGAAINYVKDFCSHNYPQYAPNFDLAKLMGHSSIVGQIGQYKAEIAAAKAKGKPHIMGETNSGKTLFDGS